MNAGLEEIRVYVVASEPTNIHRNRNSTPLNRTEDFTIHKSPLSLSSRSSSSIVVKPFQGLTMLYSFSLQVH